MVHGPVREVVRGPGPLDLSTDWGSVFSGHPALVNLKTGLKNHSGLQTAFQDFFKLI